jgi:hypothetical protein
MLSELPKGKRDWQAQAPRFAQQRRETITLVKPLGGIVFRVYDDRENAEFGARDAEDGVCQQNAAQPLTLMRAIYREPTQERRRYDWIARKLIRNIGGQRVESNTGRRQRVETSQLTGLNVHRDETRCDSPLHILGCLLNKVTIQQY